MMEHELKRLAKGELIRMSAEAVAAKEDLEKQLADTRRQLSDAQDQKKEARAQLAGTRESLTGAQDELCSVRETLAAVRSEAQTMRQLADSLRAQLIDAQAVLTETQTALYRAEETLRLRDTDLVAAREQISRLNGQIAGQKKQLEAREITLDSVGSLAEATAGLNGIFEAAQNTARQYLENIELRMKRQEEECARIEERSRAEADYLIHETTEKCEQMVKEAKAECEQMRYIAEEENRRKWSGLSEQLQMISREIVNTVSKPEKSKGGTTRASKKA